MRYFGGKWRIAPWIIEHLPPHRVYVEPFGGGGSVLLRKDRSKGEVYNDINGDVVNLFRVLQKPYTHAQLKWSLQYTPYSRAEFNRAYQPTQDPVERARRLLIRSHMGYGTAGSSRASKVGFHNATIGGRPYSEVWRNFTQHIDAYTERLQGVIIEERPALDVISYYDAHDTAFYVDPPYVLAQRSAGKVYPHEMTEADHRELADKLHALQGFVILNGYAGSLYEELYPEWERVDKNTHSLPTIKRIESLWLNPQTSAALMDISQ